MNIYIKIFCLLILLLVINKNFLNAKNKKSNIEYAKEINKIDEINNLQKLNDLLHKINDFKIKILITKKIENLKTAKKETDFEKKINKIEKNKQINYAFQYFLKIGSIPFSETTEAMIFLVEQGESSLIEIHNYLLNEYNFSKRKPTLNRSIFLNLLKIIKTINSEKSLPILKKLANSEQSFISNNVNETLEWINKKVKYPLKYEKILLMAPDDIPPTYSKNNVIKNQTNKIKTSTLPQKTNDSQIKDPYNKMSDDEIMGVFSETKQSTLSYRNIEAENRISILQNLVADTYNSMKPWKYKNNKKENEIFSEIKKLYKNVIEEYPGTLYEIRAHYSMFAAYQYKQDFDSAIIILQIVENKFKGTKYENESKHKQALTYLQGKKEPSKALAILNQIPSIYEPYNIDITKARCFLETKEFENADLHYQYMKETYPERIEDINFLYQQVYKFKNEK